MATSRFLGHNDPVAMGDSEPLLDIEQAARFLNVSETSLRRWTNDGRLACMRVGRRRERRFRRADLLAFMETEPVGRARQDSAVQFHGTHLCGLYASDEGQLKQALAFLADGFEPGTVSFVVGGDAMRDRVLSALGRQRPNLAKDIAEGRLVVSAYASSSAEQLTWWETRMQEALRRGATSLRALGDAEGFANAASREELQTCELEFDRRVSRQFPVVAMCQYDVRLFSGLMVLEALKAHPDCFRPPTERVLA